MKKAGFVILLGAICTGIGVYLVPFGFQLADREIKMMKGELLPFRIDSQKPVTLELGSNEFIYNLNQLNDGINIRTIIDLGFDYPFNIKLEDDELLVSAEVRTPEGETIAKIVDNQWVVNLNKVIASDRNYNSIAFEVIDSDQVPALQVKLKPENTIYLGGFFHLPNNNTLLVSAEGMIYNLDPANRSEYIQTFFKYPSEEHLGEMVTSDIHVTRTSEWIIPLGVVFSTLGAILIPYGFWILDKEKKSKRKTRRRTRKSKIVTKKKAHTIQLVEGFFASCMHGKSHLEKRGGRLRWEER